MQPFDEPAGPLGTTVPPSRRRILIVEDDLDLGTLMVGLLEDAGYSPQLVTSPELATGRYDLIVADYLAPRYLPGAPWPHLERLRHLGVSAGVPILGFTGHQEALGDDPHRLGVAAVAVKPFDLDDLLRTIERLLGGRGDSDASRATDQAQR
jgi:two-component system, OmpR family, response regulator QseB